MPTTFPCVWTDNRFEQLKKEQALLRLDDAIVDRPIKPDATLYRNAVQNVQSELYVRRAPLRNMTPERFRQQGVHDRMLNAVSRELDVYDGQIRLLEIDIKQQLRSPTRINQRVPQNPADASPAASATGDTRVRGIRNPTPGRNILPEEQGVIHRQDTVRVPTAGPTAEPSQQAVSPSRAGDMLEAGRQRASDLLEQHHVGIILASTNLQVIIDCANEGVAADVCLGRILLANGVATTLSGAMQILSPGVVVKLTLIGKVSAVIHLTYNTANTLYNYQQWAAAEYENYRINQERKRWTQSNLESGSLDEDVETLRGRIEAAIRPWLVEADAACEELSRQAHRNAMNAMRLKEQLARLRAFSAPDMERLNRFADQADHLAATQQQIAALKARSSQALAQISAIAADPCGDRKPAIAAWEAIQLAAAEAGQLGRDVSAGEQEAASSHANLKLLHDIRDPDQPSRRPNRQRGKP
jgi:hypothetical protein